MPTRFAVKTGLWSDTTTWDSGALPVAGDVIYPNGFTVTLDQDINVASLNNNVSNIYVPNIATPAMTGDSQPSGIVISGGFFPGYNPYFAFNQIVNNANFWLVNANSGWLGYTFPTAKIIKRYFIRITNTNNWNPKTFYFEGSNDGFATAGVQLDYVASATNAVNYLSVLLTNTTAYTSYRVRVITTQGSVGYCGISQLEMTESSGTVYGTITGGSFTVPASLSGTRNIVQSGDGIKSTTGNQTVVNVNAISGATVNFNVASGGYIFNPNWITANTNSTKGVAINGNCTVNFNSNIFGQTTSGVYNDTAAGQIYINAGATVTINGNVYAPPGAAGSFTYQINLIASTSNAAILNINGDVISSNLSGYTYPILISSLATVNIVGNLTSVVGYCLFSETGSTVNLTGTATVTNANSLPAIFMTIKNVVVTNLLTINGSITNKNNSNTIIANRIRFVSTATPVWIYQTNAGTDMALSYGTPVTGPYPAEADVRYNTPYGASPTRTGTLRVPLPQYVSQGVLTDNTTGTAYLSATDVWNVLTSNITTAGSIGERLKNASTVQTNGDQLAAYIV